VLREYGFTCFRGPEPAWYQRRRMPAPARRLGHLADVLTAHRPPAVLPRETLDGLWNIPASMLLFPMHGGRRHIPASVRVRRGLRGLDRAARERRVFHLWLHPTNLADQPERMFAAMRGILERVAELRSAGSIEVRTMGSLVDRSTAGSLSTRTLVDA
jgi:hypothetical protein